ncbi:unnamed protein product [Lathyrus oleraceus]
MLKLLWNLCKKSDNLWVKWIHSYYIKGGELMNMDAKARHSWIMRVIFHQREKIAHVQTLWQHQLQCDRFTTKKVYLKLRSMSKNKVIWNRMIYDNVVRPRTVMRLWLACHGRLPTKARLCRFRLIDTNTCYLCSHEETLDHLFYGCRESKAIWLKILEWIQVDHVPKEWWEELG